MFWLVSPSFTLPQDNLTSSPAMAEPTNTVFAELEILQNNITALHDTRALGWVSAPNLRGTSSILYSCLLTLFASIYTALHLNVPPSGSSFRSLLFTKVRWSLTALFAPELVLYYAATQLVQARKMAKRMSELYNKQYKKEGTVTSVNPDKVLDTSNSPCPWETKLDAFSRKTQAAFDLVWGFFAVMGGFEMEVSGEPDKKIGTLSPKGILRLGEVNLKPFIVPRARIEDRSKADTLQKGLVLLQVGWMALQCIVRKLYGLPLTLLELHTMVHVVCAMAMYACWLRVSGQPCL